MNKKLTIYLSIFLLSSCATMFNGTTKNIHMMTSNGDSVKADITSKGGIQTITLPALLMCKKEMIYLSMLKKTNVTIHLLTSLISI